MKIVFSAPAWEEYLHWQKTDRKVLARVNKLIRDVQRSPFDGIGKPERLQHALAGYWSRRINDEHRLVYRIEGDSILIAQVRYHY